MKIGLVTPYVYPLPGGVNDHVGHLYESLRVRGHDVRILTASHGLQRRSEGDVIRIGKGFSVPANGSVGTLTVSPRYRSQIRDVLDHERFDLLHFHEPFVPFLTLMTLRESRSVNVATFHAFAGYAPGYQIGGRMLGPVAASRLQPRRGDPGYRGGAGRGARRARRRFPGAASRAGRGRPRRAPRPHPRG